MLDLSGVLEACDLEAALDSGLRQGVTAVGYLSRRLKALGSQGRAGTAALRELLDDRRAGQRPAESRQELAVSRLLVAAGLPRPRRQHELRRNGRVVARFDLAYPDARIGIEFVSYRHHFGAAAWRRDVSRTNSAAADDWLVFNLTEGDWQEGCRTAAEGISQAYSRRTAA